MSILTKSIFPQYPQFRLLVYILPPASLYQVLISDMYYWSSLPNVKWIREKSKKKKGDQTVNSYVLISVHIPPLVGDLRMLRHSHDWYSELYTIWSLLSFLVLSPVFPPYSFKHSQVNKFGSIETALCLLLSLSTMHLLLFYIYVLKFNSSSKFQLYLLSNCPRSLVVLPISLNSEDT